MAAAIDAAATGPRITHELDLRVKYYVLRVHAEASRRARVAVDTEPADSAHAEAPPELHAVDPVTLGRAAQGPDKSWTWILSANQEPDREARRQVTKQTQSAIECGGYTFGPGRELHLRHIGAMVAKTQLVSPSCGTWPSVPKPCGAGPSLTFEKGVVMDVAARLCRQGRPVVAVNAASAYHAGGGFLTGGRHALEEAICVQSTIFPSLERGQAIASEIGLEAPSFVKPRKDGRPWHMHLPPDGALLSPQVEVFRRGSLEGYPFEEDTVEMEAIVSVAMPNKNGTMSDSPVDAPADDVEYMEGLKARWRAVLTATVALTQADCIVIPDAGCGVFQNAPESVGAALGEMLRVTSGSLKEVFIVSPSPKADRFVKAVRAALEGETVRHGIQLGPASPPVFEGGARGRKQPPVKSTRPRWSFETGRGFKPFDDDCQEELEAAHRSFVSGGAERVRVTSGGNRVNVDFKQMLQVVDGSSRTRRIERAAPA